MPDKIQINLIYTNGNEISIAIENIIKMESKYDEKTGEKNIYIKYK